MNRIDGRGDDEMRTLSFDVDIALNATGSVLVATGSTRVICAVTINEGVPHWMKEQNMGGGWLTAEYSMLPYSTHTRKPRDTARGKPDGRGIEIQRLIGRALRAVVDLDRLGPRTMWVDCDVLQADGGTRTAAITGACLAVSIACQRLIAAKKLATTPVKNFVAAVSVGILEGRPVLDLNYEEDRAVSVDFNLVANDAGQLVEVQGSGEEATFSTDQLNEMMALGLLGIGRLIAAQKEAFNRVVEATKSLI